MSSFSNAYQNKTQETLMPNRFIYKLQNFQETFQRLSLRLSTSTSTTTEEEECRRL